MVHLPNQGFNCVLKIGSNSSNQTSLADGAEAMILKELSNQIDIYNLPYGFVYKFSMAVFDEKTQEWSYFSNDSNTVDTRISKIYI